MHSRLVDECIAKRWLLTVASYAMMSTQVLGEVQDSISKPRWRNR
ncbi:MAG: hypothetical protein RR551_01435 [Mucinivorans sp.]